MYPLTPSKVFVVEDVKSDDLCMVRLNRLLDAVGYSPDDVVWITDDNLGEAVADLQCLWPPETVPAGKIRTYMRPWVCNRIEVTGNRPDLRPLLKKCPEGTSQGELARIFGHINIAEDQHPHKHDRAQNTVCWPTYNLGTITGCPHGCLYCGEGKSGKFLGVGLNLEEYMEKVVGPVIEAYPWNKVFRMILQGADLMSFEPEYGLFDLFSTKLAEYEGRYGHFHTGGANVDWLADLAHKDRLIGVWSTTCESISQDIEPGSGAACERVDAGRKCQEMGIPVRYKFKPIIPVKNWRQEYADIIKYMLENSKPESIGFCVYMWLPFETLASQIDLDLLDSDFVEAARKAIPEMKGVKTGPFPHEIRKEIYQHMIREVRKWDKDVLLYVSTETREMWDELKGELGQDPACYICACSSVAVPGRKLALSPGLKFSTYARSPVYK